MLAVIASGGFNLAPEASAQSNEFRGVWVDAWGAGFLDASQATKLIADCRTYNFNAVVVQMRRRGDAFYTPGVAGNDPKTTAIAAGCDALQDLITKAHTGSPRIEVHCWVTTHVIWSSLTPPSQAGHVVNLHPEYLMRDSTGTNYLAEGFYLDPGHPDATMWNYVMATNIVRRYDVDGFHWDYIRYPQLDSGYNPTALARYNSEFGLTGQPSPSDVQFSNWRRRQVTDFLRWVNSDLLSIRSNLVISCAVFGSRSDAFANRFQDWASWNSEGIIDICMPMGYTSDNALFQSRVTDAFNNQGVRRVYSGQGAYLNTKENTVAQLNYIRSKPLLGSVLYSYRTPNSGTVDIPGTLTYIRDNSQPTWVDVPAIPWKATPAKGILRGTVTRQIGGTAVYNANLTITTLPARNQKTEPHGKFVFFETTPGTYTITATAAELAPVSTNITIAAGQNLALSLVLLPDNTPPVISSVVATIVSDTVATINWLTDENSNSAVDYGPSIAYGNVASNATLTINHSISLSGLAPNTQYHFRVRSRNPTILQTNSGDFVFTTNPSGVVNDLILDDETATVVGAWTQTSTTPGFHGIGYRYRGAGTGANYVEFRPNILTPGYYQVSAWYVAGAVGSNRTTNSPHVITYGGGTQTIGVNQEANGSQWFSLGIFPFTSGTNGCIRVTDAIPEPTGNLTFADGIKFSFVAPPAIIAQPQGTNVNQGGNTTFSVTATGATPLIFQWCYDGTNIAGATASSYTVLNAQPTNEGDYSVVITNAVGSVTSSVVSLTVNIPPSIASQPQNQSVRIGKDATFLVTAGGTEPLSYQWRFHGTNLPGATQDEFIRFAAQPNHAGSYSVVLSNRAGSLISSNALLTVNPWSPVQFQSVTRRPDGRVQFTISGEAHEPLWIDRSPNLPPDWSELTNLLNATSNVIFTDDDSTNDSQFFYRARQ
jgi:uncharacterized lipoprotein YddW (UPF0748 family)